MSPRCLLVLAALAGSLSSFAAPTGRIRERFDADWRFQMEPPIKRVGTDFAWVWRRADGVSLDTEAIPADVLSTETRWTPIRVGQDAFHDRVGYVWYKTDLGTGAKPKNLYLHFESVDDNALVFLNGHRLKRHEGWNEPFDVPVGADWNPDGPNQLVMLVENTASAGGLGGPVWLDVPHEAVTPKEGNPTFDDQRWRTVHLPHDYVVEGTFDEHGDAGHGSLPVATAWYRKTFTLPKTFEGKSMWIDFDGIYRASSVYLNGHLLGDWPSGYASFRYDITPYAKVGEKNVLAVHVDPTRGEGWWYEGGGIYRHVWLNAAAPVHVKPWGVGVHADVKGPEGTAAPADVVVNTAVTNESGIPEMFSLTTRVLDPHGQTVDSVTKDSIVPPHSWVSIDQTAHVKSSILWSIEEPNLYKLQTTITQHGHEVDQLTTNFGIRTLRFDGQTGFYLNGKSVKLKGTCNHQDHAGVGIAVPDGLLEWRIKKLKEMGSNAYRCSHNPPAPELLDICDRLGMVVMDETRHLGETTIAKTPSGTVAGSMEELRSLILRDRNHPSVIMWSLFNEEPLQGTDEGAKIFADEQKMIKQLDPTRPCTGASNGGWGTGITLVEDLQGFNYGIGYYDQFRKKFPNMPSFGSETASTVSTRGIYANDKEKGYVSAYDANYPGWAATAEQAWKPIAERPWMEGAFVWTGFDYKGEPTPYVWPCINSHFGIIDIAGFPKDNFYYYKAWWGDKPIVHVLPHWNWAGKEGQPIDVWAYANGDEVELFLNGESLGRKPMPAYEHVSWSVPYAPGTLEARSYKAGRVMATDKVSTTGAPVALRVHSTNRRILADSEEVSVVEVEVIDAEGRVVPTAMNPITFSVSGPSRVVGVGNGDPSSHEPDVASQRSAFNGLCMALVGRASTAGSTTVTASAPGLKSATLVVETAGGKE